MVIQACDIPERQNSDDNIRLLAAASNVYARAKSLMAIQLLLTVPAALASSVIMALEPTTKVWLTFFSVTVALTDALFSTASYPADVRFGVHSFTLRPTTFVPAVQGRTAICPALRPNHADIETAQNMRPGIALSGGYSCQSEDSEIGGMKNQHGNNHLH